MLKTSSFSLFSFCAIFIFASFALSPISKQDKEGKKREVNGNLVKKAFEKKNGASTASEEYYLSLPNGEFYIKFCESNVELGNIERYLLEFEEEDEVMIKAEVEFKNGNWDICEDDPEDKQSRTGDYIIIHRLIKQKEKQN